MFEWLQDIDWSEVAMIGFCFLLVVALGAFVADMFVTEPYTVQGQVIGAEYTGIATWKVATSDRVFSGASGTMSCPGK